MKSYKFEILQNTGDYHWDNDPDEEYFTGTIEQLNNYINNKVASRKLKQIGWDGEFADINEDDINELMSTSRIQKN